MKSKKYYSNINNTPIDIWNKIFDTGDIRHIEKCDDIDLIKPTYEHSIYVKQLQDSYYDYFGISDEIKEHLMRIANIELMKFKIECGEKGIIKVQLARLEQEHRERSIENKQKFEEQVVLLCQYFKMDFNTDKMTVKRYYTYLNSYINQSKELESRYNGKD